MNLTDFLPLIEDTTVHNYLQNNARPKIDFFELRSKEVEHTLFPHYAKNKWTGDKLTFPSVELVQVFRALYQSIRRVNPIIAMGNPIDPNPVLKLPCFKYRFIKELSLDALNPNHRRHGLYYHKGFACHNCGIVCNRFIMAKAPDGAVHRDLYDEYLTTALTVGHIIPRSSGGKDHLDNYRPLCYPCNYKEGNSFYHMLLNPALFEQYCKNRLVYKKNRGNFKDGEFLAQISGIKMINKRVYFVFTDEGTYPADSVIFVKQ